MSRSAPVSLRRLLAPLREAGLVGTATGALDVDVRALQHDSRAVRPGTCFFAIRGAEADGHRFIGDAVAAGAVAVVGTRLPDERDDGVAYIEVSDSRAALAEAAAVFFDHPSRELDLVGVTGTNGKTTVSSLLYHLFGALGETAGLVGTVEVRIGARRIDATHTTPDALAFNRLLREMVDAGCTACAAEVSSHALDQERARGLRFAAAVFTNLSHDHLDYHGTVDAYRAAKARLFAHLDADAFAVVNRDDADWQAMVADTPARVVTVGTEAEADVPFAIEENAPGGLRLRLDGDARRYRLAGAFNAFNLAAAYAVGRGLGHDRAAVLDALAEAPAPAGRLETFRADDGRTAIVDYAHTPDALDNVLGTVRDMMPDGARLWCVFGCGGDRDRTKRPEMAAAAERWADRVVLTNDNPRTEAPDQILADVRAGLRDADAALVLPDRAEAIAHALGDAAPGDVVVIAGKGHEDYQIVGTERRPFDDRAEVRRHFQIRTLSPS